jgi:hypothetical protein
MIDKSYLRSSIFRHLDGLAVAPVAIALKNKGVLEYILENRQANLTELKTRFKANEGYLNVGLRVLCSQGFLDYHIDNATDGIHFTINDKTPTAFSMVPLYQDAVDLLQFSTQFHPRIFEDAPFERLDQIFEKFKLNYGIDFSDDVLENEVQKQILKHIEGYLIGPTIVRLAMNGMFHKYFMETSFRPEEFHKNPESFKKILNFFTYLDWFREKNGNYQFTETGLFFCQKSECLWRYGFIPAYICQN